MKINLIDSRSKKTLTFPINPEDIEVSQGTKKLSFSHVIGDSEMPKGAKPLNISFSGLLPDAKTNVPSFKSSAQANDIMKQVTKWQESDADLKLIISGTPWNLDVFVDDFKVIYSGVLIRFSIKLIESKSITISKTAGKPMKKPKKRPVKKPKPKTYTVKSGDNLWNIAKKYTGKGINWKKMWSLNKSKSRSKNPHLIYPGEKFKIPSGW